MHFRITFIIGLLLTQHTVAAFPTLALKPVVLKQIHSPTTITYAPDGNGRLFVCDQPGKIYIIQGGMMLPTPFLNIASNSNVAPDNGPGPAVTIGSGYDERGLLGLAFHPGFATPDSPGYRKFYVNYNKPYVVGTDPAPPQVGDPVDCVTVIAEFEVSPLNPNLAPLASERRLLVFTQPQSNHNGGQLEFGPDGFLYIGCGDGGSSNDNNAGHTGGSAIAPRPTNALGNGQDKTRYLGKILRINPVDPDGGGPLTYSIPPSNPFVGIGGGVKEEIYCFGMRNPWKFSFDKRAGGTNRMFCGDVGQGRIEEINLIVSGGNYGWRYKEGIELPTFSVGSPVPGGVVTDPIAMYAHVGVVTSPVLPQLGLSVTGGFVYRGSAIPGLQGKYIFGDYSSTGGASDGRIMGLEETAPNSGVFTLTQALPLASSNPIVGQRLLCLGEDESGEIYIGLKTKGGVLELDGAMPSGGIYKIVTPQSYSKSLQASKDNTIFSEDVDYSRDYSDGTGYLYAGRTGPNYGPYNRRALVAFDLSGQVPYPALIQSAQLKLKLSKAGPSSAGASFTVHRLTQTWGEGTSLNVTGGYGAPATTSDATWTYRFFNTTAWPTPGGNFTATASATALQSGASFMTWTNTTLLKTDVQSWVNAPATNAGWIIRSNETTNTTACQFSSIQSGGSPPALDITYDAAPTAPFDTWLATYFSTNLIGQFVDPEGDNDGDGIKNQIEYAYGLNPLAFDESSDFATALAPAALGATDFTVTFRRDSSAEDLIYKLQTSSDLLLWTTIAQSTAGAVTVAQTGSVSVAEGAPNGTIRLVAVTQTLPSGANDKKFVRLQVDRF